MSAPPCSLTTAPGSISSEPPGWMTTSFVTWNGLSSAPQTTSPTTSSPATTVDSTAHEAAVGTPANTVNA